MDITKIVYEALEDILGLPKDEIPGIVDTDLRENGMIDSLSLVVLFTEIADQIGKTVDFSKINKEQCNTITGIIDIVENL